LVFCQFGYSIISPAPRRDTPIEEWTKKHGVTLVEEPSFSPLTRHERDVTLVGIFHYAI